MCVLRAWPPSKHQRNTVYPNPYKQKQGNTPTQFKLLLKNMHRKPHKKPLKPKIDDMDTCVCGLSQPSTVDTEHTILNAKPLTLNTKPQILNPKP